MNHGVSQMEFAELAGMNVAHYGRIERGVGNPGLETLVRIAGVLGLDPSDLVRGIRLQDLPERDRPAYSVADFLRERSRREAH